MKLHLRVRNITGRTLRILTFRPGDRVRYAMNRFHDMWHVLSDPAGAHLLGRLLWSLAHQRRPGTLFLIAAPHLVPNPFDADRSDPIVLVNGRVTPLDTRTCRALRRALPHLGPSDRTVRLHTPGLDQPEGAWRGRPDDHVRFVRAGGLLTIRGTAEPLRIEARSLVRLAIPAGWPANHEYVGDGEVQVFGAFRQRCRCAALARRAAQADGDDPSDDGFAARVWARTAALVENRRRESGQGEAG